MDLQRRLLVKDREGLYFLQDTKIEHFYRQLAFTGSINLIG